MNVQNPHLFYNSDFLLQCVHERHYLKQDYTLKRGNHTICVVLLENLRRNLVWNLCPDLNLLKCLQNNWGVDPDKNQKWFIFRI